MEKRIIGLGIVYIVSIIMSLFMHKLEPDNIWYPIYSGTICVLLTVFLMNLPL